MAEYIGQVTLAGQARGASQVPFMTWDATLSETYDLQNEITDHPVEEGATVSDHIRTRPIGLTMEILVSDIPSDDGTVEAFGALDPGRARAAQQRIEQLAEGQVFDVLTKYKVYESMALESMSVPRTIATGSALRFNLKFKHVRFVTTKTISIAKTNTHKAKKKVAIGKQAPFDWGTDEAALFTASGLGTDEAQREDSSGYTQITGDELPGADTGVAGPVPYGPPGPVKPSELPRARRAAKAARGRP